MPATAIRLAERATIHTPAVLIDTRGGLLWDVASCRCPTRHFFRTPHRTAEQRREEWTGISRDELVEHFTALDVRQAIERVRPA